jgi:phosphoribosyl 1,2-cyclic phosphate phosphodiesterase
MRVTLLGSGSSTGVPAIGPGGWGECDPANPRNRRTRASLLVEQGGTTVLVDTSPDLRQQMLREEKHRIDGVLYTHSHADHVHGIDDLRSVNFHMGAAIDAYASTETCADLRDRFGYIFDLSDDPRRAAVEPGKLDTWRPQVALHEITGPFEIGAIPVVSFEQQHGRMSSLGFRFNRVAYSTDVKAISEESFGVLEGVDVWFVDCLREEPHNTHAHLDLALEWIERVKPKRAILCHLSIHVDYDELNAKTPDAVEAGYDGMVVEV